MWEDTIVEEVHTIREQLLARFGGDLHKYCEYVRLLPAHTDTAHQSALPPAPSPDVNSGLKAD